MRIPSLRRRLPSALLALLIALLCCAGALAATEKGAGWHTRKDDQGVEQGYWVPYSSAHNAEDSGDDSNTYRHPTFRGTAYGTKWNYSLTLGWTARPLWLYSGDTKILFRQNVEAGNPQDIIQLTLWTRTHYPDLRLLMEGTALEVFTRNDIEEILVQNGSNAQEAVVTRYVVDNLVQMVEQTGRPFAEVKELWLGEAEGPRIVFADGTTQQWAPGAEGAAPVPTAP